MKLVKQSQMESTSVTDAHVQLIDALFTDQYHLHVI